MGSKGSSIRKVNGERGCVFYFVLRGGLYRALLLPLPLPSPLPEDSCLSFQPLVLSTWSKPWSKLLSTLYVANLCQPGLNHASCYAKQAFLDTFASILWEGPFQLWRAAMVYIPWRSSHHKLSNFASKVQRPFYGFGLSITSCTTQLTSYQVKKPFCKPSMCKD